MVRILKNKKLLLIIVSSLLLILIILKVIQVINYNINNYNDLISRKESERESLQSTLNRLQNINAELKNISTKYKSFPENYTLTAYIENIIKRNKFNIYMENLLPKTLSSTELVKEQRIEIKFRGMPLESFIKFIYKVENSPYLIKIKYCRLKKTIKDNFDIDFELAAYSKNG